MGDVDSVTFKYKFSDDYNPLYANGAYGGVSPRGEIVVHFYFERAAVVREQTNQLDPEGRVGEVISTEPDDVNQQIIRFIQTGVVLDKDVARSLHSWLGKQLDALDEEINEQNES